jgi:nitrite reductase/ring-hydroxylating ferredoxin subunit/DMSO/TMAO reductase YedYZ heme-binding membrane subunit
MGHAYQAVGWNRQKKMYDLTLWGGVVLFLAVFVVFGFVRYPDATAETLLIRGLGAAALLLLHVVLVIGPLCRLSPRFLPLLYNRRHMGVSMFVLALAHAAFATIQFHALGDLNPLVSILSGETQGGTLSNFPFQPLGLLALSSLFLLAATSHDFWLVNLTPPVWKSLHMMVYAAYALLVLHVVLGVLQAETSPLLAGLLGGGMVAVLGLHVAAAFREKPADRRLSARPDGYVDVCAVDDIPEKRAHVATVAGERVAVFKYDGKLSVVSNVCRHQNGPLGEGRIIDGYITCPWLGYQYCPHNGASPPPFTEKVPTFKARVEEGRVWVYERPNPPGTPVEPVRLDGKA